MGDETYVLSFLSGYNFFTHHNHRGNFGGEIQATRSGSLITVRCININLSCTPPGLPPQKDDDTVSSITFSSEKMLIKRNIRMNQIWRLQSKSNTNRK